jgi:cytokinin dehydrogenase
MKNRRTPQISSRRGFAKAVAGGTLLAGFEAGLGTWVIATAASAASGVPFHTLPPLDGKLLLDDGARKRYANDYGGIVHKQPLAVLLPGSVDDIVHVVRFARRHRLRIAARGQGHQPFGQAQVESGIVIDMRSLQAVHSVSSDRIEVDAGADWRAVVHAALSRGAAPPVLTNHLGLTVGGTLSIGGIGVTTFRHGAQVDQVLELEVVTGDGKLQTCSKQGRPDLFEAALAGQGHVAIVTRAVLRLAPAKPMVREYLLQYSDVAKMLDDERSIAFGRRFDGAVALILASPQGWSFTLSGIRQFGPDDMPDDAAMIAGLKPLPGSVQIRDQKYLDYFDAIPPIPPGAHADLGLLVPGSVAARFLGETLPRLTADDLGTAKGMRVFFWKREPFTRPLFRIPEERTLVYMAMLRGEATDPAAVARMLAGNRALFERDRALGGTFYPFCALELTASDWKRHYGEAGRALAGAKRRYDPDGVFATGPNPPLT